MYITVTLLPTTMVHRPCRQGFGPVQAPHWKKVQRGRRRKKRKPSAGEDPAATKLGRSKGLKYVCSNCGQMGHNVATCKKPASTNGKKRKAVNSQQKHKRHKKDTTSAEVNHTSTHAHENDFVQRATAGETNAGQSGERERRHVSRFVEERHQRFDARAQSRRLRGRPRGSCSAKVNDKGKEKQKGKGKEKQKGKGQEKQKGRGKEKQNGKARGGSNGKGRAKNRGRG